MSEGMPQQVVDPDLMLTGDPFENQMLSNEVQRLGSEVALLRTKMNYWKNIALTYKAHIEQANAAAEEAKAKEAAEAEADDAVAEGGEELPATDEPPADDTGEQPLSESSEG